MPTPSADPLLHTLRTWHRLGAGELATRLGLSRATLMRAVRALGPQVVSGGRARRTAYAARRPLRGSLEPLPLFRISPEGRVEDVAELRPTHPAGSAVAFGVGCEWPLDPDMADGWFGGLPYFLDDMRPQGFLGRQFGRAVAGLLQVPEDPQYWSEDDTLHALAVLGSDQPGCYVLGEPALRRWQDAAHAPQPVPDAQVESTWLGLADQAMTTGVPGSSAGGEFPKFTACRHIDGEPVHVIVKFSGSDDSPGSTRWGDLLACEHHALQALHLHLGIPAARSRLHRVGGRTLLEVERFDRHGLRGRSPVCSWAALNPALFGLAGKPWTQAADALQQAGLVDGATCTAIHRLWQFGQLIGNTDMHDGNLSFRPGLRLTPAYDMLPMLYAPVRGAELPARELAPAMPLPAQRADWMAAARAAQAFWATAAGDARLSSAFRRTCEANGERVAQLVADV